MTKIIIPALYVFLITFSALASIEDQCPRNIVGHWKCISKPFDPRWKDAWPDYEYQMTMKVKDGIVYSYTWDDEELLVDHVWRRETEPRNGQYRWDQNFCKENTLVSCIYNTDAQTGERVGWMLCEKIKLDGPNHYTKIVSGGNATYTCTRVE